MSACPAVKQQSIIAKNFFNFNEKSARNKSNQESPKAFQHYCFPITLSAFSHSNFRCVFSPSHQEKIVFLANAHFRDPPSIPSGLIRCCQLRLEISPCGLRFATRIFLYPSSCAFYLGNAMKSACHSSPSPSRARARAYVQSVYMSCVRLRGASLSAKFMPQNA